MAVCNCNCNVKRYNECMHTNKVHMMPPFSVSFVFFSLPFYCSFRRVADNGHTRKIHPKIERTICAKLINFCVNRLFALRSHSMRSFSCHAAQSVNQCIVSRACVYRFYPLRVCFMVAKITDNHNKLSKLAFLRLKQKPKSKTSRAQAMDIELLIHVHCTRTEHWEL